MKSTFNSASTSEFRNTKVMFRDFMDGKVNYSYSEWKHLSADCKAAALYLNFYDTIMANLYRARQHKPVSGDDADLVSVAIEKCNHIVRVLDNEPEKYTRGYVALVMYNAFAVTLSQLVSSKQKQFDVFECVHTEDLNPESESGTLNVVEVLGNNNSFSIGDELDKQRICQLVDEQPAYIKTIIEKLINGGKLGTKQESMLPKLREIFAEFNPMSAENLI